MKLRLKYRLGFSFMYVHSIQQMARGNARYGEDNTLTIRTETPEFSLWFRHDVVRRLFINFHASSRTRGAWPRFEWWQYQPVPGRTSHNKFLIPEVHWILNDGLSLPLSLLARAFRFSAAMFLSKGCSGAVAVRARVPTLWFPAKKKKERKTKEEDLATLRTKTRPWVAVIRVLHLIFSFLQAVKQLFCTVASPSKEIKVAQLRSKQFHWVRNKILDRKWFHWNSCSWYCCRDLVPCELKVDCDKDT